MLAEIRTKSQITIPKSIVSSLGLHEGDQLEVYEQDGIICLAPVAVYPKKYIENLQKEVTELKQKIANGTQPVFTDVNSMLDALEDG